MSQLFLSDMFPFSTSYSRATCHYN